MAIIPIENCIYVCYTISVYLCAERGDNMTKLQDILSKEEYTVYTAYCVQGRKLWEIVDDTGLSINQVLNRIKTARRKIIAAYNLERGAK